MYIFTLCIHSSCGFGIIIICWIFTCWIKLIEIIEAYILITRRALNDFILWDFIFQDFYHDRVDTTDLIWNGFIII